MWFTKLANLLHIDITTSEWHVWTTLRIKEQVSLFLQLQTCNMALTMQGQMTWQSTCKHSQFHWSLAKKRVIWKKDCIKLINIHQTVWNCKQKQHTITYKTSKLGSWDSHCWNHQATFFQGISSSKLGSWENHCWNIQATFFKVSHLLALEYVLCKGSVELWMFTLTLPCHLTLHCQCHVACLKL